MRLAVLSDSHGNAVAFEAVIRDLREQSPDAVVFLGDLVNLVLHIDGYIKERIEKGILQEPIVRSREDELSATFVTKETLEQIMQNRFDFVISTIKSISDELLEATQVVRG